MVFLSFTVDLYDLCYFPCVWFFFQDKKKYIPYKYSYMLFQIAFFNSWLEIYGRDSQFCNLMLQMEDFSSFKKF